MTTISTVIKYIKSNDIKWVRIQFVDLEGKIHDFSVSSTEITDESFEKGISSSPELREVYPLMENEEDELVIVPNAKTFVRVPWEKSTILILGEVKIANKSENYLMDPTHIVKHMNTNLKAAGLSTARFSSEVEFNIFSAVTTDKTELGNSSTYLIESNEGKWNPNPIWNENNGAYIGTPYDLSSPVRNQIAETLTENFNYPVEYNSHGREQTGHQKIKIKSNSLENSVNGFMRLKYVAKNVATMGEGIATFMPFPVSTERGNSTVIGQSLWKRDKNVFYSSTDKYSQLSQHGRYYIGGILEHSQAICAFANPTVNSYKRLKADPFYVGWSKLPFEVMITVPNKIENRDLNKEIKFMSADSSINPYLLYPVIIAAGLNGLKKKIDPGKAVDKPIRKMNLREKREYRIRTLPESLMGALEALQSDGEFLKGVIPSNMLSAYMDMKLEEISKSNSEVTPWEMKKYFNI